MCPDDGEYRLACDCSDPAAHFHIDDDRHQTENDHPEQGVSEERSSLHRENDLPEIDKAAERRHDAECEAENSFQNDWPICPATRAIFTNSSWSLIKADGSLTAFVSLSMAPFRRCIWSFNRSRPAACISGPAFALSIFLDALSASSFK